MSIHFKDPLTTFRFLVEVESANTIVAAFTSFSGVSMKVDMVSYRPGSEGRGVTDDIPALTSFEPVTLTRGVIGDNDFLEWIQSVAPGTTEAATGKSMFRTINVVALDDRGNRAVTWSLMDAIPVAYTLGAMDSANSSVLSESVQFKIGGFKRLTNAALRFPNPEVVADIVSPAVMPAVQHSVLPANWPPPMPPLPIAGRRPP